MPNTPQKSDSTFQPSKQRTGFTKKKVRKSIFMSVVLLFVGQERADEKHLVEQEFISENDVLIEDMCVVFVYQRKFWSNTLEFLMRFD